MITKKIQAIEVGVFDEKLTAAVLAADRVLGWGSTGTLSWLVDPKIYGTHILIHDEDDADGMFYRSPRLAECDWKFRVGDEAIHGWSHGAEIELSKNRAFARSCGGHWISIRLLEDGNIEFEVDCRPSERSWGDSPHDLIEEPWLSGVELRAARIERLHRAMRTIE